MTPTEALARLHESGRIRYPWRAGMLTTCGRRIVPANRGGLAPVRAVYDSRDGLAEGQHDRGSPPLDWTTAEPDLTDPATLGCLLALVREAYGDPNLSAVRERDAGWIIAESLCSSVLCDGRYWRGDTEAEALTAALVAAAEGA